MLPQGEKYELHSIHKTSSSKAEKSSEEVIDVLNSVFGENDQVDQGQPASPTGAVIDEANLLPRIKSDNPVPSSIQDIHLFQNGKDKSAEKLLQLIKHELVDISKFPDYKHTNV